MQGPAADSSSDSCVLTATGAPVQPWGAVQCSGVGCSGVIVAGEMVSALLPLATIHTHPNGDAVEHFLKRFVTRTFHLLLCGNSHLEQPPQLTPALANNGSARRPNAPHESGTFQKKRKKEKRKRKKTCIKKKA